MLEGVSFLTGFRVPPRERCTGWGKREAEGRDQPALAMRRCGGGSDLDRSAGIGKIGLQTASFFQFGQSAGPIGWWGGHSFPTTRHCSLRKCLIGSGPVE